MTSISAQTSASVSTDRAIVGTTPTSRARRPDADRREVAPRAARRCCLGGARPERLPFDDLFWLRLPDMVVKGVLAYDETVSLDDALHLARARLAGVSRFSQRLAHQDTSAPVWVDVEDFDAANHVTEYRLPDASGDEAFHALCDRLAAAPMDMRRPLWDMALIQRPGGRSAVMLRVHHALADGPRVILAAIMCRDDRDGKAMVAQLRAQLGKLTLAQRLGLLKARLHTAWVAKKVAGAMVARAPDPLTGIKSGHEVVTRAARFVDPPWSVRDLKQVARGWGGGTINDVLLAALAGGVRTYLGAHGDAVDSLRLRCMQTVNIGHTRDMGNAVSVGFSELPVDEADRGARYARVRGGNAALKASAEPRVAAALRAQMGRLSAEQTRAVYGQMTDTCSLYVSNVRGPTEPLTLARHPVSNITWHGPRFGSIGLEVPVISYGDIFNVGVVADADHITDVRSLVDAITDEMAELRRAART